MELLDWALDEIWPLAVAAVIAVYLFAMVRREMRTPDGIPPKPEKLAGYDVEWCANCSIWVPAKAPWCGLKGCARPHRTG